jgi:CubicO group peptidase (beta-lactamase class C family)
MRKPLLLLFIMVHSVFARLCAQSTMPADLRESEPAAAAMSADRLQRIDRFIGEYIDKHWIAGAAALIARNGKIVYYKALGNDDLANHTPMKRNEIFRIASQSKAITSVAAMILYEQGKFLLDDPISKYIPEFRDTRVLASFNPSDTTYTTVAAKRQITVRDLLTHVSGLDYPLIGSKPMVAIYAKAKIPVGIGTPYYRLDTVMKKLAALPLVHQPGESWTYSFGVDLLGYLVEVWSGTSLDEFFRRNIFEPLGMKDSYFYLPAEKQSRLATLYTEDSVHRLVQVAANEPVASYPDSHGRFFSGGAGLSSTLMDYAIFLQMMLNGGEYNGHRILSRNTVRLMTTNQIGDMKLGDNKFGLGFEIETEKGSARLPVNIGTISWGGYFGTAYWADPKEKLVGLLMIQLYPNSHGDIVDKFKVMAYQAITD